MAWMHDQLLAFAQRNLIYLARCGKCSKPTAREVVITPVCWSETTLDSWGDSKGVASPCEEGVPLSDLPIGCTIEVENREGGIRRFGGDQGSDGRGRGDALVEEGHAKEGVAEGGEETKGRLCLGALSASGHQQGPCWRNSHFAPCQRLSRVFLVVCIASGRRRE